MKHALLFVLLIAGAAPADSVLSESFSGSVFPPELWAIYNADGGVRSWQRGTTKVRTLPAGAVVTSESRTLRNDDWLVTRRLMPLPGADEFSFWCRAHNSAKPESVEVWLSTGRPEPEDFTVLLGGFRTAAVSYERRVFALTGFRSMPVYIALRYRSLGRRSLYVDDFAGVPYVPVDVGVANVVVPRRYENPDTTLVPAAVVKNYGSVVQAGFTVEFAFLTAGGDTVFRSGAVAGTIEPQQEVLIAAQDGWRTVLGEYRVVVRTALSGDMEARNDKMERQFSVVAGEVHDAALNAILQPVGVIAPGPVTPRVEVENLGTVAENVPVRFRIFSGGSPVYADSQTVSVGARSTTTVEFAVWQAVPGSFRLEAMTRLPGDINPGNDTQVGSLQVEALTHDVGLAEILAPRDTVRQYDSVLPAAVVFNGGDYAESFRVTMRIGSGYADTVRMTLAAGAADTVGFRGWQAAEPGRVGVEAFTELAGDDDPANDTLPGQVFVDPMQGMVSGGDRVMAATIRVRPDGGVVARCTAPAGTHLRLTVYSVDGRTVAERQMRAGAGENELVWEPKSSGDHVGSGVYLVRLGSAFGGYAVKVVVP